MAFSDELKNGVEKDIEGYNQEINNYIPRLKDEYIKENDTFIDDYFSSRIKDSNIDLSGVPYERKKAMALKEFAKYDLRASIFVVVPSLLLSKIVSQPSRKLATILSSYLVTFP